MSNYMKLRNALHFHATKTKDYDCKLDIKLKLKRGKNTKILFRSENKIHSMNDFFKGVYFKLKILSEIIVINRQ